MRQTVKHFLKILVIFLFMIIIGLVGMFAVNYFDKGGAQAIGVIK